MPRPAACGNFRLAGNNGETTEMARHIVPPRWKKGQSGNPRGRPRKDFAMDAMLRAVGPEIMQRVIDIALGKIRCKPSVQLSAAIYVLDRAYGNPGKAVAFYDDRDASYAERPFVIISTPEEATEEEEEWSPALLEAAE
jgi:hypothetical protein